MSLGVQQTTLSKFDTVTFVSNVRMQSHDHLIRWMAYIVNVE